MVLRFLSTYESVEIKTDGEPSIVKIARRVQARRDKPTTLAQTSVGGHQEIRAVERANGTVQAQLRAYYLDVQERVEVRAIPGTQLFPWILRHSVWTVVRNESDQRTKQTPYESTRGCRYESALVPFREVAMAKIADADKMRAGKLDSAWVKSVLALVSGIRRAPFGMLLLLSLQLSAVGSSGIAGDFFASLLALGFGLVGGTHWLWLRGLASTLAFAFDVWELLDKVPVGFVGRDNEASGKISSSWLSWNAAAESAWELFLQLVKLGVGPVSELAGLVEGEVRKHRATPADEVDAGSVASCMVHFWLMCCRSGAVSWPFPLFCMTLNEMGLSVGRGAVVGASLTNLGASRVCWPRTLVGLWRFWSSASPHSCSG